MVWASMQRTLLWAAVFFAAVPPNAVASRRSRSSAARPQTLQDEDFHHGATTTICNHLRRALDKYATSPSTALWHHIEGAVVHGLNPTEDGARAKIAQWMRQQCDPGMWRRFIDTAPYPACNGTMSQPPAWQTSVCAGLRTCAQRHVEDAASPPHIAILMGSTSKKTATPSAATMALFTISLPSIAKTVECGFRYTVYVGYDAGDAFFDSAPGLDTLTTWFQRHVRDPLRDGGISIDLVPVRVANPSSKPGPVFNAVARHAQAAGADFFYRINDDTLMLTPWAGKFACALCSLGPPYGVVGPVESVRGDILTHDFVHAMHLDIFREYYPAALTDWWLDDWISKVYGPARSYRLADVKAIHLINTHGTRYVVDQSRVRELQPLLNQGRQRIRDFVAANLSALVFEGRNEFEHAPFGEVLSVR